MKKTVGGFDEIQEETMGVFTLAVVKRCHRPRVQEFVKKSTAVSPLVPVFHGDNVPGAVAHP